jgi:hypothetical protein
LQSFFSRRALVFFVFVSFEGMFFLEPR